MKTLNEFKNDLENDRTLADKINCATLAALISSMSMAGYETTPEELQDAIRFSLNDPKQTGTLILVTQIIVA